MMPSSTHGDPQLGIDIHLCFVPFPCPLPSLHLSVVFDPFDYLPFIGATVEIAGMKRTTAGTGGIDIHIPPGFPFAPLFPTWDDETFMGSSTVLADSDPLTYTALPVLGCQVLGMPSPPRMKKRGLRMRLLPTEVNLAIPKTVYVGGSPTISLMGMAMRAGFKLAARGVFTGLGKLAKSRAGQWLGRAFKRGRQKLFKNMKPGFLKCKILRAEPVNILTGEVSLEQSDFTLPGRIPIEWMRSYASNLRRKGACGVGWETPADGRLEFDLTDGSVIFHYPDEGPAIFPQRPDAEGDEAAVLELIDGALLSDHGDEWRVRTKSDLIYHFPKALAENVNVDLQELPLDRISDLCGNWLEFQRRGSRLMAIRESSERYLRFEYDDGFIDTITLYIPASDFTHKFVSYEYDETGDLVSVRDALENPYTFVYDNHHMVQHTNRVGLSFYYEYDKSESDWRVIHSWGDGGLYDYHFAYWLEIQETRITDSLGHVSTVKYNETGLPILEIDPLGGRTIFEYDEVGRSSAVIDASNNRTEFMYDARGNLLRLTYPDGSKVSIEIDAYNKPASITDPNDAVWRQEWDEKGLLASQTSPLGSTITYQYNDKGLLTGITNAIGLTKRFNYDHDSNVTTITDSQGNRTHAVWNELGNIIQRTDALGHQTHYQYDKKYRLSAILLPNNSSIELTYDHNDNITCIKAEDGSETKFDYFGFNYVKKRYESSGFTVEYHYNTEEQLTGVTNQRNEFYELKRDALGRITEEVDYWGQTTKFQYDLSGIITKKTDADGREIRFSVDKLGRILCKSYGNIDEDDSFVEEFTYDRIGNIISCKNKHIIIERQFDLEGKITQEKQGDFVIKNSYDKLGRRILLETSTGSTIHYNHDTSGQKESIQINGRENIAFERDAYDRVIQQTMGSDLEQLFTYDNEGKLLFTGIKNDRDWLQRTEYEYDVTGNLIQRNDSVNGIDQFQYDTMGQLTRFIDSNGFSQELLQDPTGIKLETQVYEQKVLKVSNGEAESSYWYREGLSNGTSYRFNRCGNLYERIDKRTNLDNKSKTASHAYDWDVNQRLSLSQSSGNITNYHYDPFGRRIAKKTSNCQTHFFWDGDTLIGERSFSSHTGSSEEYISSIFREYVYYPDSFRPLALVDHESSSSKVYFYYNDINGCPVRLLSAKGEVAWSAKYETSGKATISESAIVTNPIRYQGQYFDEETELHYNRYRYYDPSIGQFISQDPIGLSGGSNLYRYAPNTLAWHDPLGLEPHYMEGWIERNGTEVPGTRTGVESGGLGKEAAGRYGLNAHTERKYIDAVEDQLQPGDVIQMRGSKNPCQPGCQPALRDVSNNKQVTAIYEASDTKTTWKYRQAEPGEFGKAKADVVLEKTRGGDVKRRRYYWSDKAGRWKSKTC